MILNIHKKDCNGSILKEVYGGNFSFVYLPKQKVLDVYQNDVVYEYSVDNINIGLHGYIVDVFLCDDEEKVALSKKELENDF